MSSVSEAAPVVLDRRASARARLWRRTHFALLHVLMVLVVALAAFPLFWTVSNSLKPRVELYTFPPSLLPKDWTLENYRDLFTVTRFPTYFWNSVVVALGATALSIVVGSLGAYSLSRFRYAGFVLYARLTLLTYMLPSVLLVIPLYLLVVRAGMADTLTSLVLTNTTFTLPFTLWLMRSYFNTIPVGLEEAALIDGCSRLQALLRVVLPVALPGIVSTAIFSFTHAWNEFLFALVFISSDRNKTLPVGLSTWVGQDTLFSWGMLLAASVLITLPVLGFYALVQRRLVLGLAEGGLKGA